MKLIAITGGIGSGKSVVCHILRAKGFPVYDCDSAAKRIMDNDEALKRQIATIFGDECLDGTKLNRKAIADIVFSDRSMLNQLNALVHNAVRADITEWTTWHKDKELLFIETAILFQSGLNMMVDGEWRVTAPVEQRIKRVMHRNNLTEDEVMNRINAQQYTPEPGSICPTLSLIHNSDDDWVLPAVNSLLAVHLSV